MKILIVSQYYYPEQFQINDIAPKLVKRGHEVTVLCGLPNYPKGVLFKGFDDKKSTEIKEKECVCNSRKSGSKRQESFEACNELFYFCL
jgi:hypothetical protein